MPARGWAGGGARYSVKKKLNKRRTNHTGYGPSLAARPSWSGQWSLWTAGSQSSGHSGLYLSRLVPSRLASHPNRQQDDVTTIEPESPRYEAKSSRNTRATPCRASESCSSSLLPSARASIDLLQHITNVHIAAHTRTHLHRNIGTRAARRCPAAAPTHEYSSPCIVCPVQMLPPPYFSACTAAISAARAAAAAAEPVGGGVGTGVETLGHPMPPVVIARGPAVAAIAAACLRVR